MHAAPGTRRARSIMPSAAHPWYRPLNAPWQVGTASREVLLLPDNLAVLSLQYAQGNRGQSLLGSTVPCLLRTYYTTPYKQVLDLGRVLGTWVTSTYGVESWSL